MGDDLVLSLTAVAGISFCSRFINYSELPEWTEWYILYPLNLTDDYLVRWGSDIKQIGIYIYHI